MTSPPPHPPAPPQTPTYKPPSPRVPLRVWYAWHRRVGITVALFVVLLSVTGIIINHGHDLGLDKSYVQNRLLLDWYGIRAPAAGNAYALDKHWVAQLGERVYFASQDVVSQNVVSQDGAQELPGNGGELRGAVALGEIFVIAREGELILLTPEGDIIERIGNAGGLPAGLQKIGVENGSLVLQAAHGFYTTDDTFLDWHHIDVDDSPWVQSQPLPDPVYQRLATQYRGRGLTVERTLLDLHSGRILGNWGVWLMDAAALAMLMLSLSGVWVWWRRRRR
ncbi:MAG: PepSY domain-containing protein [Gammaproteobacteria bacterium]|nr:PepSY domain-containing protein [Gammaproteobacteria bacterium]